MRGIMRIFMASIFVCGTFILAPALPAQTNWWVDDNAPGDPGPGDPSVSDPLENGSSAHPFDAIQEGINAASNGDTALVADGTYTGTGNRDIDFLGKAITVRSENGPDNCIVDCQGSSSENHRGFYFHSGEGLDSILEGLTIKNGYASDSGGGGILCENTSPTIKGNIITQNYYELTGGGGIFCDNGSPMIIGNTITYNYSALVSLFNGGGGGIGSVGGSPNIKNNLVSNNYIINLGGGIFCREGAPVIAGNIIANNSSMLNFPEGGGGGICCNLNEPGFPLITNNIISGNWAEEAGSVGGGILLFFASPTISSNLITDNYGSSGGGIEVYGSFFEHPITIEGNSITGNTYSGVRCWLESNDTLIISNNIIKENENISYGGGVFCWGGGSVIIANSTIAGNYLTGSGDSVYGGGVCCRSEGSVTITNSTIAGNYLTGSGVSGYGMGIYRESGSVTVINSIIWGNSPDGIYGSATVTYSDVQGGYSGPGNINADPLFVTGPLGDYFLSQIAAGQPQNSPCVDAGDPLSDMIVGTTRTDMKPDTGIIDMGYHYPPAEIRIPPGHLLQETAFEPRIEGTE